MPEGKKSPYMGEIGRSSGGINFLKDPDRSTGRSDGGQPASYLESRPQQGGGPAAGIDVQQAEIPAGGAILKADPVTTTYESGEIAEGGRKSFRVS